MIDINTNDIIADMIIVCGNDNEAIIKKYEPMVLKAHNAQLSSQFCYAFDGSNIIEHGKIVAASGNAQLNYQFAYFHPTADMKLHSKAVYDADSPLSSYEFAKLPNCSKEEKLRHQERVINSKDYELILKFATYINGVELYKLAYGFVYAVNYHAKEVNKNLDVDKNVFEFYDRIINDTFIFANIPGCKAREIKMLGDLIIMYGDAYNNLAFIRKHPNANISKHIKAIADSCCASAIHDAALLNISNEDLLLLEDALIETREVIYFLELASLQGIDLQKLEDAYIDIGNIDELVVFTRRNYNNGINIKRIEQEVMKHGSPMDFARLLKVPGVDTDTLHQMIIASKDPEANEHCVDHYPDFKYLEQHRRFSKKIKNIAPAPLDIAEKTDRSIQKRLILLAKNK